ncbi:hypothetical protein D3C81_1656380 [compost metagenome]
MQAQLVDDFDFQSRHRGVNPLSEVAVANLDVLQGFLQGLTQTFGQVDGAVMPAGAANGNGDVGAVAGGEARQPLVQVGEDVLKHFFDLRLCRQVFSHRRIETRLRAQFRLPVGVGQAAHIEYQIRVYRHAALEAKGLDQKCGPRLRLVQQTQLDGVAQLVQVQVGGVDLQVGEVGNRAEQGGFILDRLGQ